MRVILLIYAALLVYAGYFAQYRDVEDLYNQLSHVVICAGVLVALWQHKAKYIAATLLILNIAELVDEYRHGNYNALKGSDYIFLAATTLIVATWKILKKN